MTSKSFSNDQRGVSVVIGATILFAFLILALSSYQAFVVPADNAEIEFNHNVQVQGEMLELRNTIMTSLITGDEGFTTVELGTQYPQRIFGINPPHPTGTLQTSPLYNLSILANGDEITTDICGEDNQTRFVQYDPQYYEFDAAGTIRYEHSLLVHDFGDTEILLTENQQLLQDGRVTLIPLRNEIHQSGMDTVSIEPKPGLVQREEVSDPTIVLPTDTAEETWLEALDGEYDEEEEDVFVEDGNLTLELSGTYSIRCEIIGLDEFPESGERAEESRDINPVGDGTIQLINQELDGNVAKLDFRNRGPSANVEEARINFATAHEGGVSPDYADIYAPGEDEPSARLFTGDDWRVLEPEIEIEGAEDEDPVTTVELDWNEISDQTFFVMSFLYDTGDQGTYFVGFDGDSPLIQVDISDDSDSTVVAGETADVLAIVFNTGAAGEDDISFIVNGTEEDSTTVDLGSGEGEQLEFAYATDSEDVGALGIEVASDVDSDTHTITVDAPPEDSPYFTVSIDETSAPVMEGENIDIEVAVTNIGGVEGTQDIVLVVDGETVDTESNVALSPDESTAVTLTWETAEGDAGTHEITVESEDDEVADTVDVFEEQAQAVSGIDGTIETAGGQNNRIVFDIEAGLDVTVTDIAVNTQNELAGVGFDETTMEIDGDEPPVTFEGEVEVFLRDFDESLEVEDDSFVDPDSEKADIVVSFDLDDGSSLELGISAREE